MTLEMHQLKNTSQIDFSGW